MAVLDRKFLFDLMHLIVQVHYPLEDLFAWKYAEKHSDSNLLEEGGECEAICCFYGLLAVELLLGCLFDHPKINQIPLKMSLLSKY